MTPRVLLLLLFLLGAATPYAQVYIPSRSSGSSVTGVNRTLDAQAGSVGNPASTTETDAVTYSLNAADITEDGDGLYVEASFQFAANANDKAGRLYIGATSCAVAAAGNNQHLIIRATVIRTSSSTFTLYCDRLLATNAPTTVTNARAQSNDWTGATTIKATVQSPTTGAASDIVWHTFRVVLQPKT